MPCTSRSPTTPISAGAALPCRSTFAFTLVELMVVIGIIALLIALLLPSLSVARQLAQRTNCAARLNQQLLAAQIHAADHRGYYPVMGVLPGLQPPDFNDENSSKYDYFSYNFAGFPRMLAPITISLASEMSFRRVLDVKSNDDVGIAETEKDGFIKYFLCPSQADSPAELVQLPMLYICSVRGPYGTTFVWYTESLSYIYNEAALGWGDRDVYNRAKGKVTSIRQSSKTMFVADGLGGSVYESRFPYPTGSPMASLYNIAIVPPITMADAFTGNGKAGDPENFDMRRHHGKINIGFCDGHVETRNLTKSDLANVYLMAP